MQTVCNMNQIESIVIIRVQYHTVTHTISISRHCGQHKIFSRGASLYKGVQRLDRALRDPTMDSPCTGRDPLRNNPRKEAALGIATQQLHALANCHYLDSIVTEQSVK